MDDRKLQPGDVCGRWTLLRRATPEPRDGCYRGRFICRCVCGFQQAVWVGDLQRNRSNGCRFASCRHRHTAGEALRKVLPPQAVEELLDSAKEQGMPLHRMLVEALRQLREARGGS